MFCLLETAPSFEQISQSITGLLLNFTAADVAAADASAECCDELTTSATLSAEYQQISTWCWVSIRVSCDELYELLQVVHALHPQAITSFFVCDMEL